MVGVRATGSPDVKLMVLAAPSTFFVSKPDTLVGHGSVEKPESSFRAFRRGTGVSRLLTICHFNIDGARGIARETVLLAENSMYDVEFVSGGK